LRNIGTTRLRSILGGKAWGAKRRRKGVRSSYSDQKPFEPKWELSARKGKKRKKRIGGGKLEPRMNIFPTTREKCGVAWIGGGGKENDFFQSASTLVGRKKKIRPVENKKSQKRKEGGGGDRGRTHSPGKPLPPGLFCPNNTKATKRTTREEKKAWHNRPSAKKHKTGKGKEEKEVQKRKKKATGLSTLGQHQI